MIQDTIWLALILLLGLIVPILTLIHLLVFNKMKRYSKQKKQKLKLLLALLIIVIPFGWIIYWIIKDKV